MSQYSTLKQQIEDLDGDSSLKEWDDLLQEIIGESEPRVLEITSYNNFASFVAVHKAGCVTGEREISFNYSGQCQKLEALKKAYLYLLDHSDIPKVDEKKQKEIEQLHQDIYDQRDKLDSFKERLRLLER